MHRMAARVALACLALACCVTWIACARADEDPEVVRARQANELSRELMSPFCPGRTLADCSSPDAAAIRQEIREALRTGEPPDEIRSQIEARFGDHVVGVPRQLLGWLIPIAALLAGAAALLWLLRRAVRRPAPAPRALSPELEARLSREIDDVESR